MGKLRARCLLAFLAITTGAPELWALATSAFVAMQFGAAAAAAAGWGIAGWLVGKPSALGAISGAVAVLVAITPTVGVFCNLMVAVVKAKFGDDDSLDAFGMHGAGGMLGAVLTGVFASSVVNPIFKDAHGRVLAAGWLEGNAHQMLNQLVGIAIALATVGTLAILKLVDLRTCRA